MKRQPAEGETIFAHDKRLTPKKMTKQGFISKLQKQHIQLNIKKTPKIFFKKMRRPK